MALKVFTFRMKPQLFNRLRIYASNRGITITDALRIMVTEFLNKYPNEIS